MSKTPEQRALDYVDKMNFPVENLAIAMWGVTDGPEGLEDDEIVDRAARKILMLKKMIMATGFSEVMLKAIMEE
jgi:hypothetical protein